MLTPRTVAPGAPRVSGWEPAYLALERTGELARRVERGLASLRSCRVCPRDCDVDRLADSYAFCKTGRHAVVSSAFPHFDRNMNTGAPVGSDREGIAAEQAVHRAPPFASFLALPVLARS